MTIAECGSLSKAADKLLMTQPSLSQFLQQFEAQLGCQLFLRTTRGVVPTVAGKAFIDDAVMIQRLYRETQIKLRDINDVKGGSVRLGISTFRAQEFLPPILEKFYSKFPEVAVEITELDTIPLETHVLEGTVDMGIVAFPLHKLRKDENIEILLNDEVVIAAKKDHPIHRYLHTGEDGRIWVNFRDAARFEFVLGPVDTRLTPLDLNLYLARWIPGLAGSQGSSSTPAKRLPSPATTTSLLRWLCQWPDAAWHSH